MNLDESAVFYRNPEDDYPLIVEASGYRLRDGSGHELIDLTSGISSTALIGQGRVEIADAIRDQINRVTYIHSSGATNPAQEELARRLADLAPGDLNRVMFTSGGSEANEVALRIIRQYHLARGKPGKRAVIALHPSYHGATAGALSLTGRWDINRDYEPYLFDVHHVPAPISFRGPFRDLEPDKLAHDAASAVEAAIESIGPDQVSAFVAEPISLSTGMAVPPDRYWQLIREICDRHDVVLMVDEIITGMGRTGALFRSAEIGVTPDVLTLAKGLAAGYAPLGATLVSQEMVDAIGSKHRRMAEVHTHSGAPIPCAVGIAVLDVIERENLVRAGREKGETLRSILEEQIAPLPFVGDIRGLGLMQAVEYVTDTETRQTFPGEATIARSVTQAMWDKGFLVRTMHHPMASVGDCTVFVPALTVSPDDLAAGVAALRDVLVGLESSWKNFSA
ncbi:aspartate aminotransferase family protein [soil metagenome]